MTRAVKRNGRLDVVRDGVRLLSLDSEMMARHVLTQRWVDEGVRDAIREALKPRG